MRFSKYGNKICFYCDIKFHSLKEKDHYIELFYMEKAKLISDIKLQPKFLLQDKFKKNGKTYRKIEYIADFTYIEKGKLVVVDCKGFLTPEYKLKKKLFEYKYKQLTIKEIK